MLLHRIEKLLKPLENRNVKPKITEIIERQPKSSNSNRPPSLLLSHSVNGDKKGSPKPLPQKTVSKKSSEPETNDPFEYTITKKGHVESAVTITWRPTGAVDGTSTIPAGLQWDFRPDEHTVLSELPRTVESLRTSFDGEISEQQDTIPVASSSKSAATRSSKGKGKGRARREDVENDGEDRLRGLPRVTPLAPIPETSNASAGTSKGKKRAREDGVDEAEADRSRGSRRARVVNRNTDVQDSLLAGELGGARRSARLKTEKEEVDSKTNEGKKGSAGGAKSKPRSRTVKTVSKKK